MKQHVVPVEESDHFRQLHTSILQETETEITKEHSLERSVYLLVPCLSGTQHRELHQWHFGVAGQKRGQHFPCLPGGRSAHSCLPEKLVPSASAQECVELHGDPGSQVLGLFWWDLGRTES